MKLVAFSVPRFDGDAAVGGRGQEPDRRQGTSGAIGLDVGIDADAFVVAGRNLDLALSDVTLRLRLHDWSRHAQ